MYALDEEVGGSDEGIRLQQSKVRDRHRLLHVNMPDFGNDDVAVACS